ncbi:MAG: hypothetical protein ACRDOK_17110 [Streptosporangiaceae bacterium]
MATAPGSESGLLRLLDKLEAAAGALADAGASLEDVLSTRVLVATTRQQDLVVAWQVVRDACDDHDVPSTLMGVTVLGYQDQLAEIQAIAAVLDG